MPDSTSVTQLQPPSPADLSLGKRNARKRTFNLTLPLSPTHCHGWYACDFREAKHIPLSPCFSNCGELEYVSVFEDWDDSPNSVVMEEDEIRNILFSPTSLASTFSTSSDNNDEIPSLVSDNDVNKEPLTTSPITPSSMSEKAERTPRPTHLSIDTSKSFGVEDLFVFPSSILIPEGSFWNCDGPDPDVPSDCHHSASPLDNYVSKVF